MSRWDVLTIVGGLLVIAGFTCAWYPLGLVVGGVLFAACGVVLDIRDSGRKGKK